MGEESKKDHLCLNLCCYFFRAPYIDNLISLSVRVHRVAVKATLGYTHHISSLSRATSIYMYLSLYIQNIYVHAHKIEELTLCAIPNGCMA